METNASAGPSPPHSSPSENGEKWAQKTELSGNKADLSKQKMPERYEPEDLLLKVSFLKHVPKEKGTRVFTAARLFNHEK